MNIYDIIYLLIFIAYLPGLILKRHSFIDVFLKFGKGIKRNRYEKSIWINASAAGEIYAGLEICKEIRKQLPDYTIIFSVGKMMKVKEKSYKIAKNNREYFDELVVFPFDFSFVINKYIKAFNPKAIILVENEIWPNLINIAKKENIRTIFANVKSSTKSKKESFFDRIYYEKISGNLTLICVQSEIDYNFYKSRMDKKEIIKITGNIKFDQMNKMKTIAEKQQLKNRFDISDEIVITFGSIHKGEESYIIEAIKHILGKYEKVKIYFAPRRIEESTFFLEFFNNNEVDCQLYSDKNFLENNLYIIDEFGILLDLYAISDLAFVGGSLIKLGGHNILEPISQGTPVIFGKYMSNFTDISNFVLEHKLGFQAKESSEILKYIEIIINEFDRELYLNKIDEVINKEKGAARKTVESLKKML